MSDAINTTDEEIWKPIPIWDGLYSASTHGRIRRDAPARGTRPGLILSPGKNSDGYALVSLKNLSGKSKTFSVHRIVCITFHGPAPKGKETNHKDRNRQNNRSDNFEYLTKKENAAYSRENFMQSRVKGQRVNTCVLQEHQVREIRELIANGVPYSKICAQYGMSKSCISLIRRRVNWKWLE